MKEENAKAGGELEKAVAHIKQILTRPFGEVQKAATFDPLDLQKDIPEGKKPNALDFLKPKKAAPTNSVDLIGLDIGTSPEPTTNTSTGGQSSSKPNGLNFLSKKNEPKQSGSIQGGGLLDLDLLGTSTLTAPPTHTNHHQVSNGANIDLFDLHVQSTPTQTNTATSFSTPVNTKKEEFGDLLDLAALAPNPLAQVPVQKKPPVKKEDLFDFGL